MELFFVHSTRHIEKAKNMSFSRARSAVQKTAALLVQSAVIEQNTLDYALNSDIFPPKTERSVSYTNILDSKFSI